MALDRLRRFVGEMAGIVDSKVPEPALLERGAAALRELVRIDDWLPDTYAEPSADRYQQYLLYADARQRFSVVSFVWGPGQQTPIHDHTVWGLIGVLRGAVRARRQRCAARVGLRNPPCRGRCRSGVAVDRRHSSRAQCI
jgi:3-mercaptopropionate dioxygenase